MLLSKSAQSIVGIFVGFAIGGLLGLVATPIAPATSGSRDGFIAHVDREARPAAVELAVVLGPTTTRGPRDDAVLPLTPEPPAAQTVDPAAKPKPKPKAKSSNAPSTERAATRPTQKAAPKPKPKPAPRLATPPPSANVPDPVIQEPAPTPEPKAEKRKPDKPPKQGKPPKPPKPPR